MVNHKNTLKELRKNQKVDIKSTNSEMDKNNKYGVYNLSCESWPKTYIGWTSTPIRIDVFVNPDLLLNEKVDYESHWLEDQHTFDDTFLLFSTSVENIGDKQCQKFW